LSGVIARHQGDITSWKLWSSASDGARIYFEIDLRRMPLRCSPTWRSLVWSAKCGKSTRLRKSTEAASSSWAAGRKWGQVAIGAISEADRHNIRGEHISVDTIPLVGEQALADAVAQCSTAACARAGPGWFADGRRDRKAVREVREQGLLVVSLNMAGSVPDAADLVVTDPVQAGVMTVMAVQIRPGSRWSG